MNVMPYLFLTTMVVVMVGVGIVFHFLWYVYNAVKSTPLHIEILFVYFICLADYANTTICFIYNPYIPQYFKIIGLD